MIQFNEQIFDSWKDYIRRTFDNTKQYKRIEIGIHGQAFKEKYIPINENNKTEITITYLEDTLISIDYNNPLTEGFNKQQEQEYFYQNQFTPEGYGDPGLEFNELNISEIDKQLRQGLKGKEVQYFKNRKLIKSQVFIYYNDNQESYPTTINFEKRTFLKQVMDLFFEKQNNKELTMKEIDLQRVFSGFDLINKTIQ